VSNAEVEGTVPAGGSGGGGSGGAPTGAPRDAAEPQRDVLSLAQLVGAPIHALVDAEAQAAMATARFIRDVGFTGPPPEAPDRLGELQMARFTRRRRLANGRESSTEVAIPLLTMLPIPALQIRDAQLDFTIRVLQTEVFPEQRQELVRNLQLKSETAVSPPATIRATFARDRTADRRRSVDMLVRMKVNIQQSDMPGGLAKLLGLAVESVVERPASEPRPERADDDAAPR